MTADRPMIPLDALAWRARNPEAWEQIVYWALADWRAGIRCSMQFYFELLRRPHMWDKTHAAGTDSPYRCNHNLRSALARLLQADYPYLDIETRRSRCDAA